MGLQAGLSPYGRVLRIALAVAVVVMAAVPLAAFAQGDTVLYLAADGYPKAGMSTVAPSGSLSNLDPDRDDDLGLALKRSSAGAGETDPAKYQLWSTGHNTVELAGPVSLVITAAIDDFSDDEDGRLRAYLQDCASNLKSCTTIATDVVGRSPWSASGGWETVTFSFGTVEHDLGGGRKLVVRVVVDKNSDSDMRIAYAAAAYPSRLIVSAGAATTTTTAPTTTTTTAPTTTTTTAATATTAATTTTAASTTTAPTTTTTTPPPTAATTTTMAASDAAAPALESTTTTTRAAVTTTTTPATIVVPELISDDPALSAPIPAAARSPELQTGGAAGDDLRAPEASPPSPRPEPSEVSAASQVTSEAVERVVNVVEVVLPSAAAQVAVSPLVIADVLVGAMFRTGQGLSIPASAAGLLVGMLTIGAERRLDRRTEQ